MRLIVIEEIDLEDNEKLVIGVADSMENADKMVDEYYGKNIKLISEHEFNDEFYRLIKTLEVEGAFKKPYRVQVLFTNYYLNQI